MPDPKDDRYFFDVLIQLEIEATLAEKRTIAEILRTASNTIELINPSVLQDDKR
ncbi:MAG: hypothetical protein U0264_05415 [Candidatus Kapaibacterium sp.]